MSTPEENGQQSLTRKQLREIRLTGSTPVISEQEAAAAATQPTPVRPPARPVPVAAPVPVPDKPAQAASGDADPAQQPLTRRQMRELEHARVGDTAPQSIIETAADSEVEPEATPSAADAVAEQDAAAVAAVDETAEAPQASTADADLEDEDRENSELVSGLPAFAPVGAAEQSEPIIFATSDAVEADAKAPSRPAFEAPASAETPEERPMVGEAFGLGVKHDEKHAARSLPFDRLLEGEGAGSQHTASTALIFTPSAGAGSLSGPIAATGELLVTGTYSLPDGLGSQGHARGTTDGKDVDAVLIDTELAPASSPTPIAASSAVSTSKPAGEVIRPPAPDKSNKLMLTLAIVAGGLALALAVTLVIAITTGVFG